MTERDTKEMTEVEALFAARRGVETPAPSDDLMARILADAAAAQPGGLEPTSETGAGWRDWIAALGGWPAMGGLAMAGITGLWLGITPTAGMTDVMAAVWGEAVSVDVFAGTDVLAWENEG